MASFELNGIISTLVSSLQQPSDISVDPSNGELFLVERKNNAIFKITPQTREIIQIHKDVGWKEPCAIAACANGSIIVGEFSRMSKLRQVSDRNISYIGNNYNKPQGITIHPITKQVYISESSNIVRRIGSYNDKPLIAGNANGKRGSTINSIGDGGLATECELNSPKSIAFLPNGDLLIVDSQHYRIRKVDNKTGIISTIAGNGTRGYSGDGGLAINAQFNLPSGIAVDSIGSLVFVSDSGNHNVRVINMKYGTISTLVGKSAISGFKGDNGSSIDAQLSYPQALAFYDNTLYIVDQSNNRIRMVKLFFMKEKVLKKIESDRMRDSNIICCGNVLKIVAPDFYHSIYGKTDKFLNLAEEYHEIIQHLIDSLIYTRKKSWHQWYNVINILFILGLIRGDNFSKLKKKMVERFSNSVNETSISSILEKLSNLRELSNGENHMIERMFDFSLFEALKIMKKTSSILSDPIILKYLVEICKKMSCPVTTPILDNYSIPSPKNLINFSQLFNDKATSDITIVIGNNELYCHKTILASSSEYFELLFKHCDSSFSDLDSNRYTIQTDEFDEELHEMIIKYCYDINLHPSRMIELTIPLFKCAHFYQIKEIYEWLADNIFIELGNYISLMTELWTYDVIAQKFVKFGLENYNEIPKNDRKQIPEEILNEIVSIRYNKSKGSSKQLNSTRPAVEFYNVRHKNTNELYY